MSLFLKYHLLPIIIVLFLAGVLYKSGIADNYLLPVQKYNKTINYPEKQSGYYKSLDSLAGYSDLIYALSNGSLVLFGSSEFEIPSYALPHNFIPRHSSCSVLTIGSAGCQSFCILSELASMRNLLNGSKIVIFVSPVWYTNAWERGASLTVFLQNINIFSCSSITQNASLDDRFKKYICSYVNNYYDFIINPSVEIQEMAYLGQPTEGIFDKIANFRTSIGLSPVKKWMLYLRLQEEYLELNNKKLQDVLKVPFQKTVCQSIKFNNGSKINWDSLYAEGLACHKKNSANNDLDVYDESYKILRQRPDSNRLWVPADIHTCREFQDLKMLLDLLKTYHADASFVVIPVNPKYFRDYNRWRILGDSIEKEVRKNNFECLNLFSRDSATYESGMLRDEQHFGDLGWYKVNRFLMNKYLINE